MSKEAWSGEGEGADLLEAQRNCAVEHLRVPLQRAKMFPSQHKHLQFLFSRIMALCTLADVLLEEGVRNAARLLAKARILSALSAITGVSELPRGAS